MTEQAAADEVIITAEDNQTKRRIKRKLENRNWQKDIIPRYVIPTLNNFGKQGIPIGVRKMCYILESWKVIEKSEFDNTQAAFTKARETGLLPIDAFQDTTRWIEDIDDVYETQSEYADRLISYVKNAPTSYYHSSLPMWTN